MDGPEHDVRMPLTAHLEELRTRVIRMLIAAGIGLVACYGLAEPIVALLLAPLTHIEGAHVIGTGVTDAFFTKLKVAFVAGLFVAGPVIFYQAWAFVAPGLYETEKRLALPFSIAASVFFVAGAVFCYVVVFPIAFQFFLAEFGTIGIAPEIRVSEYLTFTSRMLLAFGITFELPVATFFLARIGVLTHRSMIAGARYAVVAIFVVAAVLTPGPDVASQLLMAGPLLLLYAVSIGVAWLVARPAADVAAAPAAE